MTAPPDHLPNPDEIVYTVVASGLERPIEMAWRTGDPDPFEQGQRAARDGIPAEANPYQDGAEQHALWAAGHEQVAGAIEASQSESS